MAQTRLCTLRIQRCPSIYILLNDLNMAAIGEAMAAEGRAQTDIETLSMFASVGLRQPDGTPKPALEVWDSYRAGR